MIGRREFLSNSALGAAALFLAKPARLASVAVSSPSDSRVEILLDEVIGTISPNIYGHFIEHLGGVVYDGVWVGENSKVPNIGGIRKDLVEEMRKIKAPVVRYPGGCFADSYDWRDGVGPAEKRPRRTNFWIESDASTAPANHLYESNRFGTDEFMRFCKLIGCQPYLGANVRSLPAEEFSRWVEYCNSPAGSTTLAEARAANGSAQPYNVRYWGVGNEAWGCGGNFTAQEYASEFRRYTAWVPQYGQQPLSLIASGPNEDNWQWTHGFFEAIALKDKDLFNSIFGWALHYYSWNLSRGKTQDWDLGKGDALKFDVQDWYEALHEGYRLESLIEGHWQAMGEFDTAHQVKLVVDEWGMWYRPGSQLAAGDFLEQTPTLRDALFSAMTLDIFNRHPEKVTLASPAQLVNCLNSLYLAHEDNFCVTPVGHVFGMYSAHQGGQALRTIISAPNLHYARDGQPTLFWGLKGSASLQLHSKNLVLTLVNPSVNEARETEITVRSASIKSGTMTLLTNSDIHAHNTFDQKNEVTPQVKDLPSAGAAITVQIPPASVTKLELTLV
jgi:alpha-N-arabinofuranosidase